MFMNISCRFQAIYYCLNMLNVTLTKIISVYLDILSGLGSHCSYNAQLNFNTYCNFNTPLTATNIGVFLEMTKGVGVILGILLVM